MHQILKGGNVKQKRAKRDANALLNEDCFECYFTTVTFLPRFSRTIHGIFETLHDHRMLI